MTECSRCLYTTNHPFGLIIDDEGICTGCRTHEEKIALDWQKRETYFESALKTALKRRSRHSDYDCVVPVRGTPEYFYLLNLLIKRYGLRVLLVKYNSHFNSHVGIANIARMRQEFDVDFVEHTSNPIVYKRLVRESIARFGSTRWPYIAGETQFPVHVAVEKKIPLVIWPYHQATEQVGAHSYLESIEMSRMSRHSYDLMGAEPHDLVRPQSLISEFDVQELEYPSDANLNRYNIRGLYMANFTPWDSRLYSEFAVTNLGALAAKNLRTFDTYDRVDDVVYMSVQDLLKYAKFGYSRVTDSLCREIRFGRISRDDAKIVETFFQSQIPQQEIDAFAQWIGAESPGINWILRWTTGPTSFMAQSPLQPEAKVTELVGSAKTFVSDFKTNTGSVHSEPGFVIIGKGLYQSEDHRI